MAKKSVGDLTSADLKGKKVFVRADLNVPLDDNQNITDDTRIRAAIPTIKFLIENGAKVILSTHLVCPTLYPSLNLNPNNTQIHIKSLHFDFHLSSSGKAKGCHSKV